MMTMKKAANELQAIREALAGGQDVKGLARRCDAVGQWLATQVLSKMASKLTREASDLRDMIDRK